MSALMSHSRTRTHSVDATNDPYVSIRSIRNGSVNVSSESGIARIVSLRSEVSGSKF